MPFPRKLTRSRLERDLPYVVAGGWRVLAAREGRGEATPESPRFRLQRLIPIPRRWSLLLAEGGEACVETTPKLVWQQERRTAKASYSIPYVGEMHVTVNAELPGAGDRESADERREIALRHVRLLVRNFLNALDRAAGPTEGNLVRLPHKEKPAADTEAG